jgi:hypothetical protein
LLLATNTPCAARFGRKGYRVPAAQHPNAPGIRSCDYGTALDRLRLFERV